MPPADYPAGTRGGIQAVTGPTRSCRPAAAGSGQAGNHRVTTAETASELTRARHACKMMSPGPGPYIPGPPAATAIVAPGSRDEAAGGTPGPETLIIIGSDKPGGRGHCISQRVFCIIASTPSVPGTQSLDPSRKLLRLLTTSPRPNWPAFALGGF